MLLHLKLKMFKAPQRFATCYSKNMAQELLGGRSMILGQNGFHLDIATNELCSSCLPGEINIAQAAPNLDGGLQ